MGDWYGSESRYGLLSADFNQNYVACFHFILLAVAIFICYSNTFDHSWHFDDTPNIVQNRVVHINDLSWEELKKPLRFSLESSGEYTRPVASITFALNYLYSGFDTTGYHVTNLCIHIICTFFVYLVFLQTLRLMSSNRVNNPVASSFFGSRDIALLGTVMWAIHPIQTQAITYIVQRQASLAAMFYMIAVYGYIRFRQHRGGAGKTAFIVLFLISWVLGVFSKQNAVLLPLAVLGYEVAFFRFSFRDHRKVLVPLVSVLFILSVVFFWLHGVEVFNYLTNAYGHRPFTMWERLLTEPIILSRYLFLILCPLSDFLTLESDIIASRGFLDPPVTLLAVVFVTALVLLSLYWLRRFPVLGFALFFFFANHLVESTFIGLELYFEHRNYLPSMFIYFAVSYYLIAICSYYRLRERFHMYAIFVFLITMLIMSAGNATYLRNDIWKDNISLLEDSVVKSPESLRSRISLGAGYLREKKYEKAEEAFTRARNQYSEQPDQYDTNTVYLLHYNRGILQMKKSDHLEAIESFQKALISRPDDRDAYVNLGYLLFLTGDLIRAEEVLAKAIGKKQSISEIYNMYGRVLYANGKVEEARKAFQDGLQAGETLDLRFNLIATYLKTNELMQARIDFYKVPSDGTKMLYFLYKALLYPDNENDKLYETIIQRLVVQKEDYCNWVEEIRANSNAEFIYPDISMIEGKLFDAYTKHYEDVDKKINNSMEQISTNCPLDT